MPRRLPSLPLSGQPFDIYNLWLLHKFLPPLKEATPNAMFGVASFICKNKSGSLLETERTAVFLFMIFRMVVDGAGPVDLLQKHQAGQLVRQSHFTKGQLQVACGLYTRRQAIRTADDKYQVGACLLYTSPSPRDRG